MDLELTWNGPVMDRDKKLKKAVCCSTNTKRKEVGAEAEEGTAAEYFWFVQW